MGKPVIKCSALACCPRVPAEFHSLVNDTDHERMRSLCSQAHQLGIRAAEGRARNRNVSNNRRIKGTVFKASKKRGQSKLSVWNLE